MGRRGSSKKRRKDRDSTFSRQSGQNFSMLGTGKDNSRNTIRRGGEGDNIIIGSRNISICFDASKALHLKKKRKEPLWKAEALKES